MRKIEPEYMSVDDGEVFCGLSKWTLRKMAYDGRIASVKVGKRLLIPVSELRRIIAEGYRPRMEK